MGRMWRIDGDGGGRGGQMLAWGGGVGLAEDRLGVVLWGWLRIGWGPVFIGLWEVAGGVGCLRTAGGLCSLGCVEGLCWVWLFVIESLLASLPRDTDCWLGQMASWEPSLVRNAIKHTALS